jgi:carbonic anhydrase
MRRNMVVRWGLVSVLSASLSACGAGDNETAKLAEKVEGLASKVETATSDLETRLERLEQGGETAAAGHGAKPSAAPAGHGAPGDVHWTYSGTGGPAEWGSLSSEFATCKSGEKQSPIDIDGGTPLGLTDIAFSYKPVAVEVINNGHTVQGNVKDAGGIVVDGTSYQLAQFHAHAPSEHTVNGKPADVEMHLVHKSAEGKLAVVGVLMQSGAHNEALAKAWAKLPREGEKVAVGTFDAATLLPADRLTYRYEGSLTTPPCTEGVRWHVMKSPVSLDASQIKAFKDLVGPNARPVQKLGERPLLLDSSKG